MWQGRASTQLDVAPLDSKAGSVCRIKVISTHFENSRLGKIRRRALRFWARWKQDFLVGVSPDVFPLARGYDCLFDANRFAGLQNAASYPIQKCSPLGVGFPTPWQPGSSNWSATCWLRETRREQITLVTRLARPAHRAKVLSSRIPSQKAGFSPTAREVPRPSLLDRGIGETSRRVCHS